MADADMIDDYELVNCIATGNATQVWEVKKQGSGQTFAMKLLLPEAFKNPEEKKALKQEATLGKTLQHPVLITIIDLKLTKKLGYFVMEYFRAPNLKQMIRGDLPGAQSRAKKMVEALAPALQYMHEKGWIHKDIKPENILVSKSGEVKLIDFSLASKPGNVVAHALKKKKSIVIQGTRTYLAPELIQRQRLTTAADMYSLGIVLYETLVGHPPFRTANPNDLLMMHIRNKPTPLTDLDDNITPEINDLVMKMLAKNPKDRPQDMNELSSAIRNIKFFKEDPMVVAKARVEKEAQSASLVEDDRLNSRMDAKRTAESGGVPQKSTAPPKPKPTPPKPEPTKKPATQQPAAQGQPQMPPGQHFPGQPMPGMPPQGMPFPGQFPGMGYPGYPMQPGMPMPGYPGMGMPPGYPMQPGMPMPGYPGMPGQPMPGQPMPGQPFPGQQAPGQPQTGQPIPGQQPPVQQPPSPAPPGQPPQKPTAPPAGSTPPPKPAPAPAPAPPVPEDDLPLASMDDLDIE